MPWEYSNKALITLCEICHEAEEKAIKENMSLFVDGFRKSEFMATDLANLLEGIAEIKLQHLHEVVASAYQYAFSSPEMQALIIEKYFINLKKTSNARYQDSQV